MHTHLFSGYTWDAYTHALTRETFNEYPHSFSRDTCNWNHLLILLDTHVMNTHIHSLNIETHVMNTHIHSLNNHEMNTQIHFSDINNKERETWLQSVKLQSRTTFAQFGRFAWLGSSALLGFTLIHLAPSPRWQVCTAWSPARWLQFTQPLLPFASSLGLAARFGSFPPLVRFDPLGPCPVLCNLLRLLVIFVEENTVPAVLRTFSFLPRFACTASCSLLALRLLPC